MTDEGRVDSDNTEGANGSSGDSVPALPRSSRLDQQPRKSSKAEQRRVAIAVDLEAANVGDTVLVAMHTSYVDRYHRDQDRTWSTATWLVVVAWSLFPAATTFGAALDARVLLIFALTSIALVVLWFMIAWWHLAWASRSYDVVRALEKVLLTSSAECAMRALITKAHPGPFFMRESFSMWLLRVLLVVGTCAAWYGMWRALENEWFKFPPPLRG